MVKKKRKKELFPEEAAVDWQLEQRGMGNFLSRQVKLFCFFLLFYISISSVFLYRNCLLVAEDGTCSKNVDSFFTILKKKSIVSNSFMCFGSVQEKLRHRGNQHNICVPESKSGRAIYIL